ncbi:hypothetical protein PQO03_16400 [Lentisphaera profundi]|uniref:Uncharacterized protein n=1 Tax=Lentisphaera profundi TaxID=1658616 RepID=A0ABY7W1H3_9BACT|nr:hypothetical protein [Lentisphaera profundi]WDE99419.1 hypothetical protein PQO03_16400 [Lentisphaera profundi]
MNTIKILLVNLSVLCMTYGIDKGPDLVPEAAAEVANYWCTWYAQNYWIGRGTDLQDLKGVTNSAAREEINYHTIFNPKDGWASTYLDKESRKDYIFLIDHGWQSKNKEEYIAGGSAFFNMITDPRDFAEYAHLEPKERLKKFNEEIKALGWSSLGLWTRGNINEKQARTFVEWSKYAGIKYWKIDGGTGGGKFFSQKVKEDIYPELILEYITGSGGNINPKWNQEHCSYPSVYDFGGNLRKGMLKMVQHVDVFRTYDASPLLMTTTTLRRTHDVLKQTQQQAKYKSVLNIQDDCNVALGLGVLVASKRHPNMGERTLKGQDLHHQLSGPRLMQKRMNEVQRLGRWARIAPAFSAGIGTYLSSSNKLIDRCVYTAWDTWAGATYGKMVSQSAPAIMARNMPLPIVETDGVAPFVCVSTYPNGPTGIATDGRVSPKKRWFEPRAKVTVQIKDASQPIGVVGRYTELVLKFSGDLAGVTNIWAQDLLDDKSVDIRTQVKIDKNTLIIPGALIDRIGLSAGDKGDLSVPGLVLQLRGENLPIAGNEFYPKVEIPQELLIKEELKEVKSKGFAGPASIEKVGYGYKVFKFNQSELAYTLKKLSEPITSGKVTFEWKMKDVDITDATRNAFLVLSSDEDALAALFAGAWTGSRQMALFENGGQNKAKKINFNPAKEMKCQLLIDMDQRLAELTINSVKTQTSFSESFTSISYLGYAVRDATTLFTMPKIIK